MLSSVKLKESLNNLQVFDEDDQNKTKRKKTSIVNIGLIKCPENKDIIMVSHNKKDKKFTFFDKSNSAIGYFTIEQLIKYIGNLQSKDFMSGVNTDVSTDIIETFIVKGSTDDLGYNIELISHLKSPFMGNTEMLIKLNNDIKDFEHKEMLNHIDKIEDIKIQRKITQCIKEFIYLLLGHTLKIISTVSVYIKDDNSRQKLKENLLHYSCAITYRMTNYILDQLEIQNEYIQNLEENLHNIVAIKSALNKKMNYLNDLLESQNKRISSLSDKLDTIILNNVKKSQEYINKSNYLDLNGGYDNNYDMQDGLYDNESSPTSNIIEEIFSTMPINKNIDISFDSENGYNSNSVDEDGQKLDYISDQNDLKLDTNEKSVVSGMYEI